MGILQRQVAAAHAPNIMGRQSLGLPSFAQAWKDFANSEDQLSLVLSLVIGALVGLVVVAFILLTGRLAARMYPAGGSGWRRVLVPVLGSLSTGYLLWRYFPFARGSGIPQTQVRTLHQRRTNPVSNGAGEVLLLLGLACQWNCARA